MFIYIVIYLLTQPSNGGLNQGVANFAITDKGTSR